MAQLEQVSRIVQYAAVIADSLSSRVLITSYDPCLDACRDEFIYAQFDIFL